MHLSKRALSLQESPIRKLDAIAKQQSCSFYRLNIGQPDVHTPKPMLEAIRAFQPDVISYGPASGIRSCRKAFAKYHSKWQPALTSDDVAVTTGGSEALLFAFTVICDPGDDILVPSPYYTNYNSFATLIGAKITPIPTSIDNNFALPSDAELDKLKTERTRAFVFSNPGNPTGAIYSKAEITRLANWCFRNGIFMIADEVYRRIWFEKAPPSALELEESKEAIVVIDSLSKTWSACGLRLGALISRNKELMEKVERLGQAKLGSQPLAQRVGIAALEMDESYYEEIRQTWKSRIDVMYAALNKIPNIKHNKPSGAFYTMVELPIESAEDFALFLLREFRSNGESVIVAPGGGFYVDSSRGKSQIRLAAVLEEDKLQRAIEILAEALVAYQGRNRDLSKS